MQHAIMLSMEKKLADYMCKCLVKTSDLRYANFGPPVAWTHFTGGIFYWFWCGEIWFTWQRLFNSIQPL